MEGSEKSWRYDPVPDRGMMLSTCQVKSSVESSGSPKLTFSLRAVPGGQQESISREELVERSTKVHLNLIQAYNLRRSYVDPSTEIVPFSPVTSPSESLFEPEGVFARIFPSSQKEVKKKNITSRYGKEEMELDLDKEGCEEIVIETRVIKSKKSKEISFSDQESIQLEMYQFPVRVTLYEVDRNGVRFSLGHTFILLPQNNHDTSSSSFQFVKTNKLYSTIYRAKSSIKVLK